jgi:sarcosine oxidase subunit alpha
MREVELLVIGGGPAGLSAAAEAAFMGARVILADSSPMLGGQLIKQTHKFFGSRDEYAGTRGFKIADILLDEIKGLSDRVETLSDTTAIGYYKEDGTVSLTRGEEEYFLIKPRKIILAAGAQERIIPFPGNDLPGVYGAGAVQTLMNVYGVVPGKRVIMVGAGNIGIIVAYQLLQAGVEVVGVLEAMPKVGGYWVHAAKIRRLGVPIHLMHSIKRAIGSEVVEGAVVMELDERFNPTGRETTVECDTICLAVGLTPTVEMLWQAGCRMRYVPQLCGYVPVRDCNLRTTNRDIWVAGDSSGIEEASSAMVEGRLAGYGAALSLGYREIPGRYESFIARLEHLRAGEVCDKIRAGIACALCEGGDE